MCVRVHYCQKYTWDVHQSVVVVQRQERMDKSYHKVVKIHT
jgi:hypothetical protein